MIQHGVNMNTPLTTFDGYPRDDIDVAQSETSLSIPSPSFRFHVANLRMENVPLTSCIVRTTRARIIRLKNDHKALLSKMEQALHEYHAEHRSTLSTASSNRNNPTATPSPSSGSTNATDTTLTETPFAKINTVAPGSPAEEAGLKPGDRVRRFGDVNWMNHENLRRVANVVQRHQGRRVEVKVVRDINDGMGQSRELSLGLIPRVNWGGRGSLGCHLLPI